MRRLCQLSRECLVRMAEDKQALPGGLGKSLSPADVDPKELAAGKKVEEEHVTGGDLPKAVKEKVKTEIALDHIAEHDHYYLGKGKTPGLLEMEKALAKVDGATKRRILTALRKGGDFEKEIPMEIQRIVQQNPQRAQDMFLREDPQRVKPVNPRLREYIQQELAKKQVPPGRGSVLSALTAMQDQINRGVIGTPTYMDVLHHEIEANRPEDWKALEGVASPKFLTLVRNNTSFTARELFDRLHAFAGDLNQIITEDKLL